MKIRTAFLAIGLIVSMQAKAHRLVAENGTEQVRLVELYSSESCSSCPPADSWMSSLQQDPGLWRVFVPVVFHVDYWNDLGWKDGLSSGSMTKRQQDLARNWAKPSIYTPAVMIDGKEWRNWPNNRIPPSGKSSPLQLAVYDEGNDNFSVHIENPGTEKLLVRIARLGMGLGADITAGENAGRRLIHNFAVLTWDAKPVVASSANLAFHLDAGGKAPGKHAIAVWIEQAGNPVPLQAVGGYL
ncbi:MAG TPA: DUF1223 domain-containing protein [Candidatus Acidoferrum sp.]|nr:DUF1223 domain-containing protein [Candidatus Acidoferrum sp.]